MKDDTAFIHVPIPNCLRLWADMLDDLEISRHVFEHFALVLAESVNRTRSAWRPDAPPSRAAGGRAAGGAAMDCGFGQFMIRFPRCRRRDSPKTLRSIKDWSLTSLDSNRVL